MTHLYQYIIYHIILKIFFYNSKVILVSFINTITEIPQVIFQERYNEDEMRAINTINEAPWVDRHNKIPVTIGGKQGVVNPMYLDPYDVFLGVYQDIQTAIHKGELENLDTDQIIANATWSALKNMTSFALDKAMVADALIDLTVAYQSDTGRRSDGKQIFKSKKPMDIFTGFGSYMTETLAPGVIIDAKKISDVFTDATTYTVGCWIKYLAEDTYDWLFGTDATTKNFGLNRTGDHIFYRNN